MTLPAVVRAPSRWPARAGLLAATAVWASTFLVTRQSLGALDPASFLTWRFGVAALVLLLVGHRSALALDRVELRRATVLGMLLGGGFLLQTTGLLTATAGLSTSLGGESLPPLSWLGGLVVVAAMFVAEMGARRCCDAMSPRVECC